jgi:hypothetical protein
MSSFTEKFPAVSSAPITGPPGSSAMAIGWMLLASPVQAPLMPWRAV